MPTDVVGYFKLDPSFPRYLDKLSDAAENALQEYGEEIKEDIIADMAEPKTGINFGKRTRRSAPGESPAIQEGALSKSLFSKILKRTLSKSTASSLRVAIGTDLDYGYELEVGRPRAKDDFGPMLPRPWLSPQLVRLNVRVLAGKLRKRVERL